MKFQYMKKKVKFIIILILFLFYINYSLKKYFYKNKLFSFCVNNNLKIKRLEELFKYKLKNNTILVFEPNKYHYECTPGFAKFFIDLGYNIDIIMNTFGKDALCLFEPIEKVELFIYENLSQIFNNSVKLNLILINIIIH